MHVEGDFPPDAVMASAPANRHLGFFVVECTTEATVLAMEPRPEFLQGSGVVHGGILSALADSAAVQALRTGTEPRRLLTSIEFKMSFLRPVPLEGGRVEARACIVRRGRRIGVCEVAVTQGGVLAAQGLFTYWFEEREPQLQRERER